jgi:1-acyl-sn-glycerol-3-phosphate acyltransferase
MKKKWLKPFYYLTTIVFLPLFGLIIVIFHPLQMLGLSIGYKWHKLSVDGMIVCLNAIMPLSGNWITIKNLSSDLPTDKPMIIVSNHQSMYDIPVIGWALRKHHPKYIAKDSLAKGIPSISYNIRNGGSIFINRKNAKESAQKILTFCKYLNETNRAGCIFAEGRREKDGNMLPLKKMGLSVMLKKMPNATVVPVALENFWHLEEYKLFPVPFGYNLKCTILPAIDRTQFDNNDAIIEEIERQIRVALHQPLEETLVSSISENA